MGDFLSAFGEMLVGRFEGPFAFRFVLQPAVAIYLAIRAGLNDARQQKTPYLWSAVSNPESRRALLREGWKDVRTVFLVAIVLDGVYQIVMFRWFYPGQVVIIAIVLAIVPYVLVRGPVTRLIRRIQ